MRYLLRYDLPTLLQNTLFCNEVNFFIIVFYDGYPSSTLYTERYSLCSMTYVTPISFVISRGTKLGHLRSNIGHWRKSTYWIVLNEVDNA